MSTPAVAAMSDIENKPATDPFFSAILANNPFERNRIGDPSQLQCDVRSIHADLLQRIDELSQRALSQRDARAVMLMGEPGVGKSHLLSRIARQSQHRGDCFVYLHNIQVRPDDLPRYLLKCCVSKLADDRRELFQHTRLFRIVADAIQHAAANVGIKYVGESNYEEAEQRLRLQLDGDESIFKIIFKFFYAVSKIDATKNDERRRKYSRQAAIAVRSVETSTDGRSA